ncbi:LOW QUALITY PROTEIN: hypothetical protein MAR_020659 [Mya arenaria]|uniref:HTH psq-type domain-containing protein n=1 Tax=Mya arenaria TaxID=6604 RepID=A0ABY7E463_MYAAR|nr:LOW QUALITY PROTEIN: hypothetical protein MAR_020167 [Mya arenaria]WAR04947.1 LOW QUALITY PROTEIN: hypothetical protein MAR_020316 [Mya arenaria]WAR05290.1 LOW QUALITY PROTEIN: hypothetical protein MAR_020659 [Mya arenaria]
MPSKYVYTKRGKTQNYSRQALKQAVDAVSKGILTVRKASATFHVPRSTIGDRISGKHELHVPNGRPPHIPRDIENKIVDAVKMAARRGIGLTRMQVLEPTLSAKDNWVWLYQFKSGKRLVGRGQAKTPRRCPSETREAYLDEGKNNEQRAHKPQGIWNCDEMSKNLEHDPVKVVAEKGSQCLS